MEFLTPSSSYLIRSQNKEPEWNSVYDDLFEQYIDTDDFSFGDNGFQRKDSGCLSSNDFALPNSTKNGYAPEYSTIPAPDAGRGADDDFWDKTLRSLEDSAVAVEEQARKASSYSSSCAHSAASNPDFLSLGGAPSPHLQSSLDPPLQSPRRRKQQFAAKNSAPGTPIKPSGVRKATGATRSKTPKMMDPSRYTSRSGFKDVWLDKNGEPLQTFDFKLPIRSAAVLSPPSSAKLAQSDSGASFTTAGGVNPNFLQQQMPMFEDQMSPLSNSFQQQARLHTPLASPLTSPAFEQDNSLFDTATLPSDHFTNPFTLQGPPTAPQSARNSWNTFSNPPTSFDDSITPDFNPWTSPHQPLGSNHQIDPTLDFGPLSPIPTTFSPTSPTTNRTNYTTNLATTGLMINCDPTLMTSSPDLFFPFTNTATTTTTSTSPTSALPPAPTSSPYYVPSQSQPLTPRTPHRRRAPSHSQTRSPSASSPSAPAPTLRSRKSLHQLHLRTSSRSRWQHRRSKSAHASSSSTVPRTQDPSIAGFVNFTPHDSARLIAGVAPSGSSKTKARREREAAEKRRRLSQAAVRAVVEAGGDLEGLRGAGVLI